MKLGYGKQPIRNVLSFDEVVLDMISSWIELFRLVSSIQLLRLMSIPGKSSILLFTFAGRHRIDVASMASGTSIFL